MDFSSAKLPSLDANSFTLGTTSVYKSAGTTRPVGPEDLVDTEGRCAGAAAPAQVDSSLEPGLGTQPALPRGVALQMTECEVARALGQAQSVEMVPGAERTVIMNFTAGERAGIYRFRSGRLVAIERGAEPPPPPPSDKRPPKKRKPASA